MLSTLQIEMAMAVSELVYDEEGFQKYEIKEGMGTLNEFKRCTIKMPRDEDYGNGCALITRKIDDQWYVGIANLWFDENSGNEKFSVIAYIRVCETELKYKNTLMLRLLKTVDKLIGEDTVYNME